MRIALDATPLTVTSGGVRRYTEELCRALAAEAPQDEFHLLSDQRFEPPAGLPCNVQVTCDVPSGLWRRWWLAGLPRELWRRRADVFHGTEFSVPYVPLCASVLSLHDLSPWMNAEWHSNVNRVRSRTPALLRFGLSTMVVTLSETVRRQAMVRFRIHPDRIRAVAPAAAERFRPVANGAGGRPPYFLFVGTLEPRKNLATLLEAFAEVRRTNGVTLVLVGRRRSDFTETIEGRDGVEWLGEVPDDELPALYSGALACVYPSLYEGFGLPVLEAMQCGAPVIVSDDRSIEEVAAGASLQVEATDVKAWVEAMRAMAELVDLRAAGRERALQRARLFSWQRTARQMREVYGEAVRRFGS